MYLLGYSMPYELCQALGIEGVMLQCQTTPGDITSLAERAKKAREHRLKCEVLGPEWNLVERTIQEPGILDRVMVMLDEMVRAGLTELALSCGLTKLKELAPAARRFYEKGYLANLEKIYQKAEALRLHVCLHTSLAPGIFLEDVVSWENWLKRFPVKANKMLLCPGCIQQAGLNIEALIRQWRPHIRIVHIRNVVGRYADGSGKDVRLDAGDIRLDAVFKELAAGGYAGPIMPEHFPEVPCENSPGVSRAFAYGYCRALIQAV